MVSYNKPSLFSTPASTQPKDTIPDKTESHIFPHYDPVPSAMFPSYLWDTPDPFRRWSLADGSGHPTCGGSHRARCRAPRQLGNHWSLLAWVSLSPKRTFKDIGNRFLYPQNTGVFCELPSFSVKLTTSFANDRNFQITWVFLEHPWFIGDGKMEEVIKVVKTWDYSWGWPRKALFKALFWRVLKA